MKCDYCGLRTYDQVQTNSENLEELCKLWIDRKISNFTYISALNRFSGNFCLHFEILQNCNEIKCQIYIFREKIR